MLRATDITVSFGGVLAVEHVSLTVGDELVGLIGPNGSGKTTFLNALTGVVDAGGRLQVGEREVRLGSPGRSHRAGIARVFQAPQMFQALSCLENVMLAAVERRRSSLMAATFGRPLMWRSEQRRVEQAREVLARVGLEPLTDARPGSLSYGRQRVLELARALASAPRVLLLDEPSAGLNDAETEALGALLSDLRADGLPMLLIDHKVGFLNSICDRLVVLELGQVVAEGSPSEVWKDQNVVRAYLGVEHSAAAE